MHNNFYLPAEWHKHKRTLIVWPNFSKRAKYCYVEVAKKIAIYEEVYLFVPKNETILAEKYVNNFPNIKIINLESNDGWVRDSGPFFLINDNNQYRSVIFDYDFCGKKYFDYEKNKKIGKTISEIIKSKNNIKAKMILEGGSITCDGEGTIITTESVLINRNKEMSKNQIEINLMRYLNCKKIIWLPNGLESDKDTGGHIDNLCRFFNPGKILLAWNDKKECRDAYKILKDSVDAKGRKLEITFIPFPKNIYINKNEYNLISNDYKKIRNINQLMAASYINHYVLNDAVICPSYDPISTKKTKNILKKCYEGRKIIMIPYKISREIMIGGGNIHCITLQMY